MTTPPYVPPKEIRMPNGELWQFCKCCQMSYGVIDRRGCCRCEDGTCRTCGEYDD